MQTPVLLYSRQKKVDTFQLSVHIFLNFHHIDFNFAQHVFTNDAFTMRVLNRILIRLNSHTIDFALCLHAHQNGLPNISVNPDLFSLLAFTTNSTLNL